MKMRIRPPRDDAEFSRQVELTYECFAGFGQPHSQTVAWLERLGRDNLRTAWLGDELAGALGILPFGQWFGGRSVSSAGISAVVVAPHLRGAGAGAKFIRGVMRDLAAGGCALSVLYPSTYGLYRKAGFEPAGSRILYRAAVSSFGLRDRSLAMRPYQPADLRAVRGVYAERARRASGNVDRTAQDWSRVLEGGADRKFSYVIERARAIEGYVCYSTSGGGSSGLAKINVRDMAASTPAAARRLLTYFADHATVTESLNWHGGPADPLFSVAREERVHVDDRVLWMLRILDVTKALEARGFPPGLNAEASFEIEDDLFPENCGRFMLRIADGRANVRRGGRGRVKLSIGALAPLYSGHLSAAGLQLAGLAAGSSDDLCALDALFCSSAPWMSDRF